MPTPKRALKRIPTFKTEAAEKTFWATADSTEYVDWSKAQAVLSRSIWRIAWPSNGNAIVSAPKLDHRAAREQ